MCEWLLSSERLFNKCFASERRVSRRLIKHGRPQSCTAEQTLNSTHFNNSSRAETQHTSSAGRQPAGKLCSTAATTSDPSLCACKCCWIGHQQLFQLNIVLQEQLTDIRSVTEGILTDAVSLLSERPAGVRHLSAEQTDHCTNCLRSTCC